MRSADGTNVFTRLVNDSQKRRHSRIGSEDPSEKSYIGSRPTTPSIIPKAQRKFEPHQNSIMDQINAVVEKLHIKKTENSCEKEN